MSVPIVLYSGIVYEYIPPTKQIGKTLSNFHRSNAQQKDYDPCLVVHATFVGKQRYEEYIQHSFQNDGPVESGNQNLSLFTNGDYIPGL